MKALTSYWEKYYLTEETTDIGTYSMCSLCANQGIIDTTQSAISPNDNYLGRKNFCICPNGQAMRKHTEKNNRSGGV